MAGDTVLIAPVTKPIPCKQGIGGFWQLGDPTPSRKTLRCPDRCPSGSRSGRADDSISPLRANTGMTRRASDRLCHLSVRNRYCPFHSKPQLLSQSLPGAATAIIPSDPRTIENRLQNRKYFIVPNWRIAAIALQIGQSFWRSLPMR
jgi:hypothetical protein